MCQKYHDWRSIIINLWLYNIIDWLYQLSFFIRWNSNNLNHHPLFVYLNIVFELIGLIIIFINLCRWLLYNFDGFQAIQSINFDWFHWFKTIIAIFDWSTISELKENKYCVIHNITSPMGYYYRINDPSNCIPQNSSDRLFDRAIQKHLISTDNTNSYQWCLHY